MKTNPFTIASKRLRYLSINQRGEDFYNENYKTWQKKSKKIQINENTSHVYGFKDLILTILPKVIYRCNAIPIKMPMMLLAQVKKILNSYEISKNVKYMKQS